MPFGNTWFRLREVCDLSPLEIRALQLLCAGANVDQIAETLALTDSDARILLRDAQEKCRRTWPWMYTSDRGFLRDVRTDMIRDAGEILGELRNSNMDRRHTRPAEDDLSPIRLATISDLVQCWERCLTGGLDEAGEEVRR